MSIPDLARASSRARRPILASAATLIVAALGTSPAEGWGEPGPSPETVALGRELFLREWTPGDPRGHGGDGLGPMYNERSCVACHSLGGPGGAGPVDKNVVLVSAASNRRLPSHSRKAEGPHAGAGAGAEADPPLVRYHAGFRDSPSVVLHKFGTPEGYAGRRATIARDLGLPVDPGSPEVARSSLAALRVFAPSKSEEFRQIEAHTLSADSRNTPPLFGARAIERVTLTTLEDVVKHQDPKFRGRIHRLQGGRVGRFGWKAQTASLSEFVHAACANELGLEVPGHHQATTPDGPIPSAGLDLDGRECQALVAFIEGLPAPTRVLGSDLDPDVLAGGRLFQEVGCAVCHRPDLGTARGIYSDLLVHEMGARLASAGRSYGSSSASDPRPAGPGEWRTPPLWGFRDSAPYLHDGRAPDLDRAVEAHGGQAATSARLYSQLEPGDRRKVESFLKSLVAPGLPDPPPDLPR